MVNVNDLMGTRHDFVGITASSGARPDTHMQRGVPDDTVFNCTHMHSSLHLSCDVPSLSTAPTRSGTSFLSPGRVIINERGTFSQRANKQEVHEFKSVSEILSSQVCQTVNEAASSSPPAG